jgi:hypothetical protein
MTMNTLSGRLASATRTIIVSEADYRRVRRDLKADGFFIVSSSMVAGGYQITYRTDPR